MPTLLCLTLTLLLGILPTSVQANDATWQALEEGSLVILMRHSLAPGIGDPPDFVVEQCDTQRNLSAGGRAQAQAVGRAFRERSILIAAVYSSRWCRAMDTAELIALGPVEPTPWLDSFFRGRGYQAQITQTAQQQIAAWEGPGNLLLVTIR
ncbi:histidine phosphatase family protein [Vreelandella alkaliphila]|uniref:histidine phosphatase family protein n=1 Tax=Vreelandella alkaliphila TaxID=272774 RepID=UPI003FD6FA3E